jgi:hypothetical protein
MSRGPHDFPPHTNLSLDSRNIFHFIVSILLIDQLTERDLHTPPCVIQEGGERIVTMEAELDDGWALRPGDESGFLFLGFGFPCGRLIIRSGINWTIKEFLEYGVEVADVDRVIRVKGGVGQ